MNCRPNKINCLHATCGLQALCGYVVDTSFAFCLSHKAMIPFLTTDNVFIVGMCCCTYFVCFELAWGLKRQVGLLQTAILGLTHEFCWVCACVVVGPIASSMKIERTLFVN